MISKNAAWIRKILRLLVNPIMQSVLLAVLLWLFIHPDPDRYVAHVVKTASRANSPREEFIHFADLNGDGTIDQYLYGNHPGSHAMLYVMEDEYKALDQWNFTGEFNGGGNRPFHRGLQ